MVYIIVLRIGMLLYIEVGLIYYFIIKQSCHVLPTIQRYFFLQQDSKKKRQAKDGFLSLIEITLIIQIKYMKILKIVISRPFIFLK